MVPVHTQDIGVCSFVYAWVSDVKGMYMMWMKVQILASMEFGKV